MEAKNLRVGNLITTTKGTKHYGHPLRVEFITENNYDLDGPLCSINGYYEKEVVGIELTKQWLIDFGFKTNENGEPQIDLDEERALGISIQETPYKYGAWLVIKSNYQYWLFSECRYVHELQNLFFAITGKELELTQEKSAEL